MRLDAFGICLLKQTASSAQSVASPSKIEGFRKFEVDLSALFSLSWQYKNCKWQDQWHPEWFCTLLGQPGGFHFLFHQKV